MLRTLLNVNTIPGCVLDTQRKKVDTNCSRGKLVQFYCLFGFYPLIDMWMYWIWLSPLVYAAKLNVNTDLFSVSGT